MAAETNITPPGVQTNSVPNPAHCDDLLCRYHFLTYQVVHQSCEKFDHWFVRKGEQPEPMPTTPIRIGLYEKFVNLSGSDSELNPVIDTSIDVNLPNIEKRLKLFITTMDPTRMPGVNLRDENDVLRIGLSRSWRRAFNTSIGVKATKHPKAYTRATLTTVYSNGLWKFYPYQRVYWESDNGPGEITSFIVDRWVHRWDFRSVSAFKWSESKSESDTISTNYASGWQWEQTFQIGYAHELLEERDYGHLASGNDLARGGGLRVSFLGGPSSFDIFRINLFLKMPIHSRWLYFVISPEVEQAKITGWDPEYRVKVGIEALFRGTYER